MKYPSVKEVRQASHTQLAMWHRFLPSPGECAIDTPEFENVLEQQACVADMIIARLSILGGITPEISKSIGWEKPEQ